jgi:hypothetical protein
MAHAGHSALKGGQLACRTHSTAQRCVERVFDTLLLLQSDEQVQQPSYTWFCGRGVCLAASMMSALQVSTTGGIGRACAGSLMSENQCLLRWGYHHLLLCTCRNLHRPVLD